ncbi:MULTISPECIES: PepSY domain-containing protein [Glycomyces]|uniref:Membrane protein YkoI n=2 Tax=Glycomyces TaxID=58113 RepID=A0A9X3PSB3_9ACTN|nr:PepSY domain-containing protein [Glycomyces lechevalierae]MDA1384428.1 PepSY domain-containing protein [Glycomyces lechevalierae]MDR7338067.1 putative membrane protein YkoI [Glycomyces lechevalierae]
MNAPTDTQQASTPDQPEATPRRFRGRQRTLVIAGAAGVLLLGGGTAAAFAADDIDDRNDRAAEQADDADDRYDADDRNGTDGDDFALPAEAIGEDAAVEAALAEVPGDVWDVDLEGTAEAPVWIVEVTDADGAEWDVVVDAFDGTVTEVLADDDANDDDGDDDGIGDDGDDDADDNETDDQDDADDND